METEALDGRLTLCSFEKALHRFWAILMIYPIVRTTAHVNSNATAAISLPLH